MTCDDRKNKHSYCEICVHHHLTDLICETGSPFMRCMGGDCLAFYKRADYERILDIGVLRVLHKLDNRTRLKNVQGLDQLKTCTKCDFAAIVDPGFDIF